MENNQLNQPYNVWMIADTHFSHKNILHHQPKRIEAMGLKDNTDIEGHDEYLVNIWLSQTKRNDHIYVMGDFIMSDQQRALHLLHRLKSNGCKIHLIVGNHDKSTYKMFNMFESIDLIKVVTFKASVFPFLEQDLEVVMCHYPMKSWQHKCWGSLMIHGHTHDNSPWEHEGSGDLQINVGIDCPIADYKLINLQQIYEVYKTMLNGHTPRQYSNTEAVKINPHYVR